MSFKYSVVEWVRSVREGSVDCMKMYEECIRRIAELDPKYNAFITINAMEPEPRVDGGWRLPLVPIAVKDNIVTRGLRTTCASRVLENYIPSYDATVVEKLKAEGALVIGKANMDEFAMGALGTTSAFGPSRNPYNPSLSPGGSSSGSAVAVASGMTPLALGSDTGGSLRLPAAWTGVYTIKPTYGLVSRYGLISYAESLEQIGPMASNASDLAYLYSVIAGYDERDATSIRVDSVGRVFESIALESPKPGLLEKLRVGVVREFLEHPQADEDLIKAFWRVLKKLEDNGVIVEECSLPLANKAPQVYYVIAFAEASSNLARYDGVRYGSRIVGFEGRSWIEVYCENRSLFGWEVKRRILLGSFILSKGYYDMYYTRALKARMKIKMQVDELLRRYELIVTPGSPVPPLPLDYDITDLSRLNAVDAPLVIPNLTGYPALTMPVGFYRGLPLTIQLIAGRLQDAFLLRISKAIEALGWS